MEEDEAVMDHVETDRVQELLGAIREDEEVDAAVRLIFRYEGEEYEVAHVREDVDEAHTDAELEAQIERLLLKGLGDPPEEDALAGFGSLQATVRWFEDAVCAYFPDEEWGGVVVVFDRVDSPLIDVALSELES